MTSKMHGVQPDRQILISCDDLSCNEQHNDTAIAAKGGLAAMGWKAVFDYDQRRLLHFCPIHQGEPS